MKTLNFITVILLVALSISLFVSIKQNDALQKENTRIENNVDSYRNGYSMYKTEYGKSAIKSQSLELTVKELKNNETELYRRIRELKIKPNTVSWVGQLASENKKEIEIKIQYVDSAKCLFYEDKYNTISGCFKGDSIPLTIITRDSLTIVASRIPAYKFLWWNWGTKGINIDIMAENPDTKFTYSKFVNLKK